MSATTPIDTEVRERARERLLDLGCERRVGVVGAGDRPGRAGPLLSTPRLSGTGIEYPVVADIDNDGSAEIVVVSNGGRPPVVAIRDVEDRWIQARRIWNQHTYHVTNVR